MIGFDNQFRELCDDILIDGINEENPLIPKEPEGF
jgi:hypothetical protein